MFSVCLYLLQDAIGGKLSYKGRLSMEMCTVTDLPDGKGKTTLTTLTLFVYEVLYDIVFLGPTEVATYLSSSLPPLPCSLIPPSLSPSSPSLLPPTHRNTQWGTSEKRMEDGQPDQRQGLRHLCKDVRGKGEMDGRL